MRRPRRRPPFCRQTSLCSSPARSVWYSFAEALTSLCMQLHVACPSIVYSITSADSRIITIVGLVQHKGNIQNMATRTLASSLYILQ